jgi:septum formation protein
MKTIILASSSPRRKKLLEQIGLPVKVDPSAIVETLNPRLKPRSQVEQLSLEKATAVAGKYPNALILAADTVVVFQNEIIGKPSTPEEAKRILGKLSGVSHTVITGFTIIDSEKNKTLTKSVETTVHFKKLSKKEIENYVATGEPMDKAGAYGIQEKGAVFIERIEGDFFTVVGLPLHVVVDAFKRFGVSIF